jgi:hypothetical protein
MRNLIRLARNLKIGDVLEYGPTWGSRWSPIVEICRTAESVEFTTGRGDKIKCSLHWKRLIKRHVPRRRITQAVSPSFVGEAVLN